jgi:cation diffusion facilitator family transporter
MSHDHLSHHNDKNLAIRSTYASVIVVGMVITIKFFGWLKTDSVSLLASLIDSLLDGISSLVNMIALRYALQPPDEEHRFGHNKAEDLAGFSQATFFAASGVFLLGNCIKRLFMPQELAYDHLGIISMIASMILTLFLVMFQFYTLKRTSSNIIKAEFLHYSSDLLSNLAVIFSLWASSYFSNKYLDPILALLISLYIIKQSWQLLYKSFQNLMDQELGQAEKNKILSVINAHPQVLSMHDLKTRYAGSKPFIQCHLVMKADITLLEAHKIAEEIEMSLLKIFPQAEVLIHQDPYGYEEYH